VLLLILSNFTKLCKHELILEAGLLKWYENVEESNIEELMNFSYTVERNQNYICNYFFHNGSTNAKAENKNGKIKKFISSNQGTRDRFLPF
jgi:transposase